MRIEKQMLNDALRVLGKVVCQIKKYTPLRVDHSYMALNRCFGLDGHRPELW